MTRSCGECGFYTEHICPVAMQHNFQPDHEACQSFSTVAWKCEICGAPVPALGLIYDHAGRKLVCGRCYTYLPPVSENQKGEERDVAN